MSCRQPILHPSGLCQYSCLGAHLIAGGLLGTQVNTLPSQLPGATCQPAGQGLMTLAGTLMTPGLARGAAVGACAASGGPEASSRTIATTAGSSRGEGLHSILSDAFLAAGSQATLVSLWRVRDRQTYRFLETFYLGLCQGHPPGEALRLAREQAIRRGQSPAVWGSFVLRGAAGEPLLAACAASLALGGAP